MLIGDGVTPGNESRGYVLRRHPAAGRPLDAAARRRGPRPARADAGLAREDAAVLSRARVRVGRASPAIAYAEEDAFRQTLKAGTSIFDLAAEETRAAEGAEISGAKAFQLHDTYGFPIDLTLEMAAEQGLLVDEVGFRQLMEEQRQRAKADARSKKGQHADTSAPTGA